MKVSRSINCSLTVMFSFIVSFFLLGYSKFLHQKRFVLGSKGLRGGHQRTIMLCKFCFVFLHFFIFQTWRIVAGKLKKLNNFETGLKLSQYFDPSWSRSGPIFVGAVLVAAQTETDVGFTLYIKNSWPQYSNDLQGRA